LSSKSVAGIASFFLPPCFKGREDEQGKRKKQNPPFFSTLATQHKG